MVENDLLALLKTEITDLKQQAEINKRMLDVLADQRNRALDELVILKAKWDTHTKQT